MGLGGLDDTLGLFSTTETTTEIEDNGNTTTNVTDTVTNETISSN